MAQKIFMTSRDLSQPTLKDPKFSKNLLSPYTMFKNPKDQLCESEGILLMDYEIFLCIY